jgi:hypothetical protein
LQRQVNKPIILNATLIGPASCSPIAANCVGVGLFDAGIVVRRQGVHILLSSYVIGQAMPVALATTPTTVNNFVPFQSIQPLQKSTISFTKFQWNAGTQPVLNDNDESGRFAPALCATGTGDVTPGAVGDLNSWIGILLTPFDANAGAGSLNDYGLSSRYVNTTNFGGGLNLGGTPFNNYTIAGTNEQGGVPSTDQWTVPTVTNTWVTYP